MDPHRRTASTGPSASSHGRERGSPYRTSARREPPAPSGPRPIALGFVVLWFLLAVQLLRVWGPGGSRALVGLGMGMAVLCIVLPVLGRRRR